MFEMPEAKRIRREDLNRPDASGWSDGVDDAELEARLNAQIAQALGLGEDTSRPPQRQPAATKLQAADVSSNSDAESELEDAAEAHGEEEGAGLDGAGYAFRLFSTAGPAPKVVLEDDSEIQGGGLARPRPSTYYLAAELSAAQEQRLEIAAVSGEDVVSRSRWRCWGLELPWKVTTVKVTRKQEPGELAAADDTDPLTNKRRRPGKKRRIAMRVEARAKMQAEEAATKMLADKEEHLKEKKKRLNRLKKVRKRAKHKERKQAAGGGGDGAGVLDGDWSTSE